MLNKCEILPYVQSNKALVGIEFTLNLIHNLKYCSEVHRTIVDVRKFAKKTVSVTPHAWPFRPETPFIDEFNKYIKKLLNGKELIIHSA